MEEHAGYNQTDSDINLDREQNPVPAVINESDKETILQSFRNIFKG